MGKQERKAKRQAKMREKVAMYDMIVANIIAGKSIIEPSEKLTNEQIAIGFSNVSSEHQISKYFMIRKYPDYMKPKLFESLRAMALENGVRMDFRVYGYPHKINWDSAEMKNKMDIWRRYTEEKEVAEGVFDYRATRSDVLARDRIVASTKYLNEAELDQKRSLIKVSILVKVTADRDDESILSMAETIQKMKAFCYRNEIKIRELRVNMIDWLRNFDIFSLRGNKEIEGKVTKKVLTDDLLANFNGYKQGRVGEDGICLGIDVLSSSPILKKLKGDPDAPENWLISAETGGGKSMLVKSMITDLLAEGFVVTVVDFEGDEYTNLASFVKAGNPDDVKVISMGKAGKVYYDPVPIPDLTGDPDVDNDLKEIAINYIMAHFRLLVGGLDGEMSQWEERVVSMAIQRMYDSAGVTDDKATWKRSKILRLKDVYEELREIVESKVLVDPDNDNVKHKAALKVQEASSIYFEEGEARFGVFENPMSADELYQAKLIVFSFGTKGAGNSIADKTLLALKQLSVAALSTQISNHCKYVKKGFNVKVWEEFQRWGEAKGSADIILNTMTGGRKRGDVNFIITNDLAVLLQEDNKVASGIRQNIQNLAIGKISDRITRDKLCKIFEIQECSDALERIAKAHATGDSTGVGGRYKFSFLFVLDTGKRCVGKVMLPQSIIKSDLFRTGVKIE